MEISRKKASSFLSLILGFFFSVSCTSHPIKSLVYTDYGSDGYQKKDLNQYYNLYNEMTLNTASILFKCHTPNQFSSKVVCKGDDSPTRENIAKAVRFFKNRGIRTSVRIYVDIADGTWRAKWKPKNLNSFEKEIIDFSRFAERLGIDILFLGSELEMITRPAYTKFWKNLISKVRREFNGEISYAANGNLSEFSKKEYQWIGFWDELDFVGITYYPVTEKTLVAENDFYLHHKSALKGISKYFSGRKLILAEVGFPLAEKGYQKPYQWVWKNTVADKKSQFNSIKGFIKAYSEMDYEGSYLWRYYPHDKMEYPLGYSLEDSLIKKIISKGL